MVTKKINGYILQIYGKRYIVLNELQNKTQTIRWLQKKNPLSLRTQVKVQKNVFHANGKQKQTKQ